MADSSLSVSGLGSGIDWQTMLTQLTQVENQSLVPMQNDQTTYSNKLAAWQSFATQLSTLNSAANDLKNGSNFDIYTSNLTSSSTTSASSLLSATTSSSATQGSYQVVVNSTAQVQKLASNSYTSTSTALNLTAGAILVNGQTVNIAATDTLQNLADKINSLNAGTTPTKVSAGIIQDSPTTYRLVLTSGTEGAAGISLENGSTSDILASMGFNNSTGPQVIKNQVAGGATSDSFSSSSTAVETLLGNSSQNLSGNVTINGKAVTIDLTDTLSTIQSNLQTAGINSSIVPTTTTSTSGTTTTTYKLQIAGMSSFTDQNNVLQSLGLIQGNRDAVTGVSGSVANTSDGSTPITSSTLITGIYGYNHNTTGDKITVSGTQHDGTTVAASDLLIDGTTTVGSLLTKIQGLFANTTATVGPDGKIQVIDNATGTSKLSVNFSTTIQDPNGGVLSFGTFSQVGAIKKSVLQQGKDASYSVDGMAMTSPTNAVTGAIPGVTLNLLGQDPNTTVNVNISKDTSGIEGKVKTLISAYNSVVSFVNTQMTYNTSTNTTGGPLFGDTTLKSIKLQLQDLIMAPVGTSSVKYLSDAGITVGDNGQLSLNSTTFENALGTNFNDVVKLFSDSGSSTDSQFQYTGNSESTASGTYAIQLSGLSPVAGTIDGQPATGLGNVLSLLNSSSSKANGLQVTYTGSNSSAGTSFTLTRGIASMLESITNQLADPLNGSLTLQENGAQSNIDKYTQKLSDAQANINQKMALMKIQFENMDTAVAKFKAIGSYLTAAITAGL